MSINPIKITNSEAPRKRVAFLSFDGLSDPLGQSQILPYLQGLVKQNFEISIFCCEKPNRLAAEKKDLETQLERDGIQWQYLIYDEKGSWFSRWQYTRRLLSMVEVVHKKKPFELLHCRSYLAALAGKKMWGRYRVPFLFDMRGFWANERRDGGIWQKNNLLHQILFRYFKYQEKHLLNNAAGIISLTEAGIKELEHSYPTLDLKQKTTIIPCCTNTALFNPTLSQKSVLKDLPADTHLLVYSGSIGTWYQTKEMIDCLLTWRIKIPTLRLLVLTRDQQALQTILATFKLPEDFIIVTAARYADMPAYLARAQAAIFFIKPAYSKIASSPTKMAECWAMDLPIISNRGIGDGDALFEKHKGGILISEYTRRAYLQACEDYLALKHEKGALRNIALENFDHRSAIKLYHQAYQNILYRSL